MTKTHSSGFNIRRLSEISIFSSLIFLSVQCFRIPAGTQFIHFGNALVVLGVLTLGARDGLISAVIGIGIFDIYNGYLPIVWITILESVIVCLVLYLTYEKLFHQKDKPGNILLVSILAAVTKIILNLSKYTFIGCYVGKLTLLSAVIASLDKIIGTFGSSVATIIAVPTLYPIFKSILHKDTGH